jgi:hypothetical protein
VALAEVRYEAVMVTVAGAAWRAMVTGNDASEVPAGTATDCGTDTSALELKSSTSAPPGPAAPARVTVPETG